MEGTCNFEKCVFAKTFFKEAKECFNYKEVWWKPLEGEPKLVEECAPIRTLIMIQELSNRLVGVEKSQEELRNESVWVQVFAEIIGKNSGLDLEQFVEERQKVVNICNMKNLIEGK